MEQKILELLSNYKFLELNNEKILQNEINDVFKKNNLNFKKEFFLSKESIIDFLLSDNNKNIGVELKTKGNAKQIYKQLERYCEFDEINSIILISNKFMGLPNNINGKDLYFLNLGVNWL